MLNRFLISSLLLTMVCHAAAHGAEPARRPSQKKGFCTLVKPDGKWKEQTTALQAKWFYSWGPNVPDELPAGLEFVPMTWDEYHATNSATIESLQRAAADGKINYLLGFNEPDQGEQSNLSVDEVVKLWPRLMKVDVPLGSPGCVHPDRQWMQDFMREAEQRKLRVDFICVHSYGGPNAKAFVERLKRVHKMFGRPIWITEFAVGDWEARDAASNRFRPEQVARFMREVLPMLEELDFVERYAWFSASPKSASLGTSALFNDDGTLTELGKLYQSF